MKGRKSTVSGKGGRLSDVVAALLIFAGTVLYLSALPRNLSPADESIYLYEAKRILGGEVMYRDVFDVITPGWMYLMALLFRIFGTDLATARIAMSFLHGIAAVGIYFTCRALGVRPGLSWPAALAYLVVCQSAWPIASQHWLSTLLCVTVLWVCAARSRRTATWTLLPGVVIGLLIAVQQQRGMVIALGVFSWLVADHRLQRRCGATVPPRRLAIQLAALVGGALLVVVPLCVRLIADAGFGRVWTALVVFPLVDYRGNAHCPWGHISIMSAWQGSLTFPRLLKYLPLVLVPTALRLGVSWLRGHGVGAARSLLLLLVFCAASMLSIAYFPDFIHIAFIAPAFFVTVAENVEWAARRVSVSSRARRVLYWAAAMVLLVASGSRLYQNMARTRAAYPVSRQTAFGRVDFANLQQARLYEKVNALMRDAPSRYLFAYPVMAHLYLLADTRNPTPFGFFIASAFRREQIQEALDLLAAKQPPYVVLLPLAPPGDPVVEWVRQHYVRIPGDDEITGLILRLRVDPDQSRRETGARGGTLPPDGPESGANDGHCA